MRFILPFLLLPFILGAQPNEAGVKEASVVPLHISARDACILGGIQGITEFMPISSTAHLVLVNRWIRPEGRQEQSSVEVEKEKRIFDFYFVVLQLGTMAVLCYVYWQQIVAMFLGLFGLNPKGLRLAINLIIGFIPAGVVGFLTDGVRQRYFHGLVCIILALIVGACIMLWVESWRKRRLSKAWLGLEDLHPRSAFAIGCLQILSLWTGMSRSMTTIVGGYLVGLSATSAVEFSFLQGLLIQAVATSYKFFGHGHEMVQCLSWKPILVGGAIAALTGLLTVRWMLRYLSNHGLQLFAYYRIALAFTIIAVGAYLGN